MVIAVLEMTMPEGHELDTLRALRGFWDATCALPGCRGGGVYQEAGSPGTALYVEIWQEVAQLENHVRSRGYDRLLAIMETAASCPELRFNLVAETRGLEWVEQLRLRTTSTAEGGE
jgi:quinol monooxygenase YgiN